MRGCDQRLAIGITHWRHTNSFRNTSLILPHRSASSLTRSCNCSLSRPVRRATSSCGAVALTIPRRGTFSIEGGAAALANRLADAIKQSGGRVRLNTPVLRLAYDSSRSRSGC